MMAHEGKWGAPEQDFGPYPSQQYDPVAHRRRLDATPPRLIAAPQQAPWEEAGYPYPPVAQQHGPIQSGPQQTAVGPQQTAVSPQQTAVTRPGPGQPVRPPSPAQRRLAARNVFIGAGVVAALAAVTLISIVAATGSHAGQATAKTIRTARVGSAVILSGNTGGERMAVTVTKVLPAARAADKPDAAPTGKRLYAVQFRLHDVGSTAYSDSPSNGAQVVDETGQSYSSALNGTASCPSFPGSENIAPGDTGLGCVVFEIPKQAKIVRVQFTLDSGFGPQTGQWTVG